MNQSLQKKCYCVKVLHLNTFCTKNIKKINDQKHILLFTIYPQLRTGNALFRVYARMTPEIFNYILEFITPEFNLRTTNFQIPILIDERLLITIR